MRLLAALAVLAVVLYATLPWWLPTARLKRWLEAQLTRQIGSAVAVGELTVSWREGVRIDSLTVANPAGFGSEALLTVPHIGMDFSPLRLAIHKRVKWMVVHSPHLRVAVDQTGRVNIQQLSMPDFDVTTTQISVRQAVAELSLPGRPEPLRLEAVGVEVRGDPWGQFAVVTMSAGLVQPSGSAPISMEAVRTGPAANRSEGMLELSFSNVDLEALDPISMGKLPLRRVAGTCSGRLRLPVRQGGVRSGQLDIEVLGLGLEPLSKPMMTAIDRIGLHIKVDVDPATNMVTASSLEVDADGIKLAGSARFHTSLLRRQWLALESMRLVGKIDPRYFITPVTAGNGAAMAGEVAVDVAYDRSQEQLHATVQLDATAASMSIDGREVKPAGQPLRLATKASGEIGSQQFVFDTTELQLGDNRLIAHGVLVNVGDVLARWAEGTRAVVEGEVRSELAATDWSAQLDIRDLDSLRRLHPALAGVLANVKLAGSITGSCRLEHREQTRVGVNLVCGPGSRLQVGDWLDTPATESIEADINWLSDGQAGVSIVETQVAMRGAKLLSRWAYSAGRWSAQARLAVSDAVWLQAQVPMLRGYGPWCQMQGEFTIMADLIGSKAAVAGRVNLQADDLDLTIYQPCRRKRTGTPLRATIEGHWNRGGDPEASKATLDMATVALGGSTIRAAGRLDAATGPEATATLAGDFTLAFDDALLNVMPELQKPISEWALAGSMIGRGSVRVNGAGVVAGQAELDATAVGFASPAGEAIKPAGMPASLQLDVRVCKDLGQVIINDFRARLGPIEGQGEALLQRPDLLCRSQFRLGTSRAQDLPTLLPGLQQFAPAGGVEVRGSLVTEIGTGSPIGKCNLTHAVVTMNALSAAVRGRRPTVDGSVQVEGLELVGGKELVDLRVRRLWSDDLRLTVGPTEATVVLDLKDPLDSPRGAVTVLAEEIDAGDLLTWLGGAGSPPALTEEYRDRLGRRVAGWIALAKRSLAGADLAVFADIGLVRNWPDRKVRQLYDAHNVIVRAAAAAGRVELEYTAGVNGGTLIDSFAVDLTAETPELTQLNTIRDMMATKNLQPQVTAIFPGNELRGSLWRELHLSTPLQEALANALDPRLPVHAVGEGVTTMFEGITRGRAAPRFVTRVFPGLNLVEYEYDRMVSFSEFRPDGSAYNDMIFSGKVYDIYIEGTTDARQIGRYEVGLILLGTPESPLWNHRYKQGRIPLLKFKASIIDGRKLDEEVSYPWPNQTMFTIFLKNNYFYRLWVESRKNNTTAVDQHAPAPGNGVPTTSH